MLLRSALRTFKPLVPRAPCVDTLRKSWRFTRGMSTANAEAQSMDGSAEALPDKVEKPKKRAARRKAEPEAKADETDAASPEAEAKPKAKRAKKNPLPKEPVGVRYEESMRPQRLEDSGQTFMSWNVAGLRALIKKDPQALQKLVELEKVDVLCLQETKLQEKHVEEVAAQLEMPGWSMQWNCSTAKLGYAGVAMLFRDAAFEAPPSVRHGIGQEEHDAEGRVLTAELPGLHLVNIYVPNSGAGLKRLDYRTSQWDKALAAYVAGLRESKPVVITGDFNCAREEIDIHNARNNLKSAGFTPEERQSFQEVLMDAGWRDTFREQHDGVHGYTYYGYRANCREKKKGWRLDYFLVSEGLKPLVHDSFILNDFLGSDHCPLGLVLKDEVPAADAAT